MSYQHKFIVFLLILLFFLTKSLAQIEDPKINITLEKFQYSPNQQLQGEIELIFKNPVENKNLELWIGQQSYKKDLITILNDLNLPYNASVKRTTLSGDASDINVIPQGKLIGFEVSLSSNNASVDINSPIIGSEVGNTFPQFPFIDIGFDDSIEWKWLGNIVNWLPFKGSDELNTNELGSASINDKNIFVCEIIDIPHEIKEIKISAKFQTFKDNIDMWAAIIKPTSLIQDTFDAGPLEPKCNLPEGRNLDFRECTINFEVPHIIQGKHLACIYSINGNGTENIFSISTDAGADTISSAICSGSNLKCIRALKNYFIQVSIPSYDGILNGQQIFKDGLTGNFDGSDFSREIKRYMGLYNTACTKSINGNCIVSLLINAQANGRLYIGGLKILIRSPGQTLTASYRDLEIRPEIITKIENQNISNYTLKIPFSLFSNFTTPNIDNFLLIPLRIIYGTELDQEPIQIFAAAAEIANESISNMLSLIDEYNSDADIRSILSFLKTDLQPAKNKLKTLETELNELDNLNITEQNKTRKRQEIINNAQEAVKNIPQTFLFKDKVPSFPAIPPSTINREKILPLAQRTDDIEKYILSVQDEIDINSEANAFKIITFSENIIEKTFITRRISTSFSDAFLIEEIPSYIARDASLIDFGDNSKASVISSNPILIKFELPQGQNTVAYMVNGNIIGELGNLKTLVVSIEGASSQPLFQGPTCGDGKCYAYLENELNCPEDCKGKIPWLSITIVIIILILGIYYINFYKGTANIRFLLKKKELFKTEVDKINLINYVKKAQKSASKEKIINMLLSKGWTKKQIDFAFKKAEK